MTTLEHLWHPRRQNKNWKYASSKKISRRSTKVWNLKQMGSKVIATNHQMQWNSTLAKQNKISAQIFFRLNKETKNV